MNNLPDNPQIEPKGLAPFKKFCMTIGEIPSSYLETMSYAEMLLWFCNYLKCTVIPAINNNAEAVKELQDLYVELKNYVDNYFTNLDVQEEINNKLDQMAEDGELTEIIAQYLQLAGILAFNTVNDLINAENLVDGSFVKTYGKNSYNDGLGEFYKIRALINTDVVDGVNLIALNKYPTLVAEKMPNNIIGNLSNLNTENKTNIVNAINEVNSKVTYSTSKPADMNKVIIIGDSYASRTDNWVTTLIEKLDLSSSDYYKSAIGSSGFVQQGQQNKTFLTLLTDVIDTLTTSQKAEITHVIVCGGANDNTHEEVDIKNAITTFVNTVNSNLPNAKTLIGEIGWTNNPNDIINYGKVVDVYSKCTINPKCYYLNNVQYTLHNYDLLLSDGVHPTADGNIALASNIHQAIMNGSCEVIYSQLQHKLNPDNNTFTIYESLNNNLTKVYNNRTSIINKEVASIIANGMTAIDLTEDIFQYAKGSYYETNRTFVVAYYTVNNKIIPINSLIGVYNGILKIYPISVNEDTGEYETLTNITGIRIPQFNINMDSLQC